RRPETVARLTALLDGSYLWGDGAARSLQDPLSFRCIPQVHGAARETLAFAGSRLATELASSQENPVVVLAEGRLISVGNFDALPLAAALDFARIGLVPVLTSASERAIKLLQSPITGLPGGRGARLRARAAGGSCGRTRAPGETASTSHHEGIEDRVTLAPLSARRLAQ